MIIRRVLSVLFPVLTVTILATVSQTAVAQSSNVTIRVMAANLNGNTQSIQPFAINIFKGLKPDVVSIQEFNYSNNTAADFRALIDNAFGTNYSYYRESGSLQIPNGIISRYPIIASGRWTDTQVSNRGFAWARIDLPGTNDLYAVSVHLLTSSSSVRATEANNLKALILSNFPANAWIVIGGDFNADSRGEACVTTFANLCPDAPIPTDAESGGDSDTNENRNKPYDYVLASHSLTNYLTNVVFASHSFPKGLVFDSRVYTPLSDVSPIVYGDSGQGQHMAVLKDFFIPAGGSNAPVAPIISSQPQSLTIPVGGNANFAVSATGTAPLAYQWRFNGTNISGALTNSYLIANAQTTNNGSYTVVITNIAGSVTSTVAALVVSNIAPSIVTDPVSLDVLVGNTVAFGVTADGTAPLTYQWRFDGTNISGATNEDYSFNNAQTNNAGSYTVIVTNAWGAATSAVATLTVSTPGTNAFTGVLVGWDVNGVTGFGPSPMAPTTNMANLSITGLTRGSGVTTNPNAATGAWGGNGFGSADSATAITAGDYATFSIAVNAGFKLSFGSVSTFSYRRSGSAPPSGLLQFQVGSGLFTDITNVAYTSTSSSGATLPPIDLSTFVALQNIGEGTNVTFRIVNYGTNVTTGNWYVFDVGTSTALDFAISGTIAPIAPPAGPPAEAPTLTTQLAGNQIIFQLTGTTGSNYIVQASTNLATTNWFPLHTNAAPLSFTNSLGDPQRFYRGMVAP